MMKRYLFIISFCIFLILPITKVIAASNGSSVRNQTSTKVQQKLESRQDALTKIQETVQTRTKQRTATGEGMLSQQKRGLVTNYYNKMSDRMWALVDRLSVLVTRIEARIAVVDNETDKDLTLVISDVNAAKTLLADTKAVLTSSDEMFQTVIASSDPKESFEILRENINDIKMNLVAVHKLLVKVIGNLEGLTGGVKYQAPTVTPGAI